MKTLATTIRPAALTLALIVAAFLLPSQLTGQYELVSQKPGYPGYATRNYTSMPEIRPLNLSILFSLARIFLPFSNDQNGLIMLKPVTPEAVFCYGNSSANRLHSIYLLSSTAPAVTASSTISDAVNTYALAPSAGSTESIEGWMLSSADWNETMTEIEYKVESWMLNESAWMEISSEPAEYVESWMLNEAEWMDIPAEPLENIESWMLDGASWTEITADPAENVESWMLNDLTWDALTSETSQGLESWMNDDTTWASGNFSSEEAQNVEPWMLNTESWNVQYTAGIK